MLLNSQQVRSLVTVFNDFNQLIRTRNEQTCAFKSRELYAQLSVYEGHSLATASARPVCGILIVLYVHALAGTDGVMMLACT
jgi:hypothetical protein